MQTGRSDSYRVATVPSVEDDNLTADGQYRVRHIRNIIGIKFLIEIKEKLCT